MREGTTNVVFLMSATKDKPPKRLEKKAYSRAKDKVSSVEALDQIDSYI